MVVSSPFAVRAELLADPFIGVVIVRSPEKILEMTATSLHLEHADILGNGGIAHGIVRMTHRSFVAGSGQLHEHTLSFVVRCDAECCKSHRKRARIAVHLDNQCRGLFGQCTKSFRSQKTSTVDEYETIADAFEFAEQMGRDENGHAELVAGALYEREHLFTTRRIEAIGRLVENEQSRIVHECLRELHALRHASRIAAHRSVAFFKQSDVAQYFGRTFARSALRQTGTAREPGDELRCAHVRRQTIVLGHVSDEAPNRRSLAHDIVPQQRGRTARWFDESEQNLDERALTGAIRADQSRDPRLD